MYTRLCCSHVYRAMEAKKQNDFVFHEKLPSMEHLEAVQGTMYCEFFSEIDTIGVCCIVEGCKYINYYYRTLFGEQHQRKSVL